MFNVLLFLLCVCVSCSRVCVGWAGWVGGQVLHYCVCFICCVCVSAGLVGKCFIGVCLCVSYVVFVFRVVVVGPAWMVDKSVFHMLLLVCVFVFRVVLCAGRVGWVGGQVKRSCWPAAQYDRQ